MAEQQVFTLWVGGSSPPESRLPTGGMFRGGTADCKSVGLFYGWFDSSTTNAFRGLAERFIAPVLKTDMGNTIVRSNRTPSTLPCRPNPARLCGVARVSHADGKASSRVSNSMAECLFSKQVVAGSSPVWLTFAYCWIFQRTESLATNEEMKVRFLLQQPLSGLSSNWFKTPDFQSGNRGSSPRSPTLSSWWRNRQTQRT